MAYPSTLIQESFLSDFDFEFNFFAVMVAELSLLMAPIPLSPATPLADAFRERRGVCHPRVRLVIFIDIGIELRFWWDFR